MAEIYGFLNGGLRPTTYCISPGSTCSKHVKFKFLGISWEEKIQGSVCVGTVGFPDLRSFLYTPNSMAVSGSLNRWVPLTGGR